MVAKLLNKHIAPTKYWHSLDDGRVQCDLCPRFCKLKDGQHGLCFVRENQGNKIILNTYGLSSGFCIDPIEKKPLNHFLPGTPVLSFGTAGCNLACKFCQNWDISKSREMHTLADSASAEKIAHTAQELNCRSVAYTYNDPVIFLEYAMDVAQACHDRNIKNIAVTAGYICHEPGIEFFSNMDAANIDLKAFSEDFYFKLTGGHLQTVLDTLVYLKHETRVWFEITTLLIPGKNDGNEELHAMSEWIVANLGKEVPLHFSAFHPEWKMLDIPSTPLSTLQRAREIALSHGINHVYTGNISDPESESTYCHHCHAMLIERNRYELTHWGLDSKGNCGQCGTPCPGVFEAHPGDWGAKRQPVQLSRFTD